MRGHTPPSRHLTHRRQGTVTSCGEATSGVRGQRWRSPSSRVQMTGSRRGFSLMYLSPLTLMLTLYSAININLNTGGGWSV